MTVEKFIRILGYIVYFLLWSPVILVGCIVIPIWYIAILLKAGCTFKESVIHAMNVMRESIQHDIDFINTGVW